MRIVGFSRPSLAIFALIFVSFVPLTSAYDGHRKNEVRRKRDGAGYDNKLVDKNVEQSRALTLFPFLLNIDRRLIKEFDKAWQDSGGGLNGRESVLLMLRMEDGRYVGKPQGFTNEYKKSTFKWNPATIAIVHTHPNSCDPRPSEEDDRVADRYEVPIFTITNRGMYVYNPATRMTSKVIDGLDWLELSKWREMQAKLISHDSKSFGSDY